MEALGKGDWNTLAEAVPNILSHGAQKRGPAYNTGGGITNDRSAKANRISSKTRRSNTPAEGTGDEQYARDSEITAARERRNDAGSNSQGSQRDAEEERRQRLANDPLAPEYYQSTYHNRPKSSGHGAPTISIGEGIFKDWFLDFALADAGTDGLTFSDPKEIGNLFNVYRPQDYDNDELRANGNSKLADAFEQMKDNMTRVIADLPGILSVTRVYHRNGEHSHVTASHEFVHVEQASLAGTVEHGGVNPNGQFGKEYLNSRPFLAAKAYIAAHMSWYLGEEAWEIPVWVISCQGERIGLNHNDAEQLTGIYCKGWLRTAAQGSARPSLK